MNLAIALLVEEELKNAGVEVVMTRSSDKTVSLDERAALANDNKVQAFVSIHQNSFEDDRSIRGLEVWYNDVKSSGGAGSKKLADAIHTYACLLYTSSSITICTPSARNASNVPGKQRASFTLLH